MLDPQFNPNEVGVANGNYFGFPSTPYKSLVVFLSVPWDVTTSYKPGTAKGPEAIIEASTQHDLFDFDVEDSWQIGHGTLPVDKFFEKKNEETRKKAAEIIDALESGVELTEELKKKRNKVNRTCGEMVDRVYHQASEWLEKGKLITLVGGDHSTPLGFLKAIGERETEFGILHIDGHADLREAYEGFTYSHASIMYNALKIHSLKAMVQVGIRDICEDEIAVAEQDERVHLYDEFKLKYQQYEGTTWAQQCDEMIEKLPARVYISVDIDGLTPENCPNTGTPLPGGLSFHQACYLIKKVVDSGRKIIGSDLVEVSPGKHGDWDANVGSRMLYKLSNLMWLSHHKE